MPGPELDYRTSSATHQQVCSHLRACSDDFVPTLESRVNLEKYAKKLVTKAITLEAWDRGVLVGLVAGYFNDPSKRRGFITSVSTIRSHMGRGIAGALLSRGIELARTRGFDEISLEVSRQSLTAIRLYCRYGFEEVGGNPHLVTMTLALKRNENVAPEDAKDRQR